MSVSFCTEIWYVKKEISSLAAEPTNWPLVRDLNRGTPLIGDVQVCFNVNCYHYFHSSNDTLLQGSSWKSTCTWGDFPTMSDLTPQWRKFARGVHQCLPAYGVGEGLPELKFSSIILSFKTSRRWLSIVCYLSTQFLWSEGLCEPKFTFFLHLAYLFDVSGQVWPSSMINNLHKNTYFILTF